MTRLAKSILLVGTIIILTAIPALYAQDDEPTTFPPHSITGIVDGSNQFSTTAAAMEITGLQNLFATAQWTFFAPTDAAWAKWGHNTENIADRIPEEFLRNLLLYQAIEGRHSTADLMTMLGDVVMANGQLAGLKSFEDNIYVNDDSKVIIPNIIARNGNIQVVDNVIL